MDSIDINYKLKKIGILQTSLARELGISKSVINNVIHGKVTAYFVALYIAKLIGCELNEIWPDLYIFKPRGPSKRRGISSKRKPLNTVTTQELVAFSMKQDAEAELKAFINKRYELSLDPNNLVDAEPIIQEMLEKYEQ